MRIDCPREEELVEAIASRRWRDRADADLAAHTRTCAICRDVAAVAGALHDEGDAAWREARVPSAAHVWWRAQVRARQEAAAAAARPIAVAQGVAAASAAGLAAAAIAFGLAASSWPEWLTMAGVSQLADARAADLLSMAIRAPEITLTIATVASGLVLMPLAVYLVLSDK